MNPSLPSTARKHDYVHTQGQFFVLIILCGRHTIMCLNTYLVKRLLQSSSIVAKS
jgi:hypothetical protein